MKAQKGWRQLCLVQLWAVQNSYNHFSDRIQSKWTWEVVWIIMTWCLSFIISLKNNKLVNFKTQKIHWQIVQLFRKAITTLIHHIRMVFRIKKLMFKINSVIKITVLSLENCKYRLNLKVGKDCRSQAVLCPKD